MSFKNCHVNLKIGDLLRIPADLDIAGNFIYGAHSIKKVEIFGTVSSVQEFDEKAIFIIDDCTGSIECQLFKARPLPPESQACVSANTFSSKLEEMAAKYCYKSLKIDPTNNSFKVGDFVQVRGDLREFNDLRSIRIKFICTGIPSYYID